MGVELGGSSRGLEVVAVAVPWQDSGATEFGAV